MARRHSGAVAKMIMLYLLCVDIDTLVGRVLLVPTVTLSLVVAWSCH